MPPVSNASLKKITNIQLEAEDTVVGDGRHWDRDEVTDARIVAYLVVYLLFYGCMVGEA